VFDTIAQENNMVKAGQIRIFTAADKSKVPLIILRVFKNKQIPDLTMCRVKYLSTMTEAEVAFEYLVRWSEYLCD
jgi:hypothetical protein